MIFKQVLTLKSDDEVIKIAPLSIVHASARNLLKRGFDDSKEDVEKIA